MKHFILVLFLLVTSSLFAQEKVVIDRDKRTADLFDENDPLSFISVVRSNVFSLAYNNLHGIERKDFLQLTGDERNGLDCWIGREGDIALLDEYGEATIITLPDGTLGYRYDPPDTMYVGLKGVDRIVFLLEAGEGTPYEKAEYLELWKQYESGFYRVLRMDAKALLTFHGANIITPLSAAWSDRFLGVNTDPSLWSVMRDSALQRLSYYQEKAENNIYRGNVRSGELNLFDFGWAAIVRDLVRSFIIGQDANEKEWRYSYENQEESGKHYESQPFTTKLSRNIIKDEQYAYDRLDSVHSILVLDPYPLTTMYGEDSVVFDGGDWKTVYPTYKKYFFVDFDPLLMINKLIICDSVGQCKMTPHTLLFCLQEGSETPELIVNLDLEGIRIRNSDLWQYFADYPSEDLWEIPQFANLKKLINKKRYRHKMALEDTRKSNGD